MLMVTPLGSTGRLWQNQPVVPWRVNRQQDRGGQEERLHDPSMGLFGWQQKIKTSRGQDLSKQYSLLNLFQVFTQALAGCGVNSLDTGAGVS